MELVSGGLSAYVDGYILGNRREPKLLSLVGNRLALQGLRVRLGKGNHAVLRGIEVVTLGYTPDLEAGPYTRLENGHTHVFLSSKRDRVVVAPCEADLPAALYGYLKVNMPLPLHAAWTQWLWAYLGKVGAVERLTSFPYPAVRVSVRPEVLMRAVREALLRGKLDDLRTELKRAA